MDRVPASLEARKQQLAGPERWQQRGERRLKRAEESGEVGKRFCAHQLLGTDHPHQNDEAGGEEETHQHQQIACATGGKDVDQQERAGGADGHRNNRKRQEGEQRGDIESRGCTPNHANPEKHGRDENDHHPGRSRDGLRKSGIKQPPRRDRRREEQAQVVGQKERRQRRDDPAEGQERQERHGHCPAPRVCRDARGRWRPGRDRQFRRRRG